MTKEKLKKNKKDESPQQSEFVVFLLTLLQHLAPKKFLTWCMRHLANSKTKWVKSLFIKIVVKKFAIDLSEYERANIDDYESFQDFFTRQIDLSHRPVATSKLVSPADGTISAVGKLEDHQLLQAKGRYYSATDLLGSSKLAKQFRDGSFLTIYLAPSDYHRVHIPTDCELQQIKYIPGELFSVNQFAAENIANLFSVNERAVFIFDSKTLGKFALVMVAATMVSGIYTKFTGLLGQDFPLNIDLSLATNLKKGDEFGRFLYGSTVILLFEKDKVDFGALKAQDKLQVRQSLLS